MKLGLSPVAEDASLSSDFKELLKYVCMGVSGKRDIPKEERDPWGYTCLLCGSLILSTFPDFACYQIHTLRAPTPLLLQNTHLSREEEGMKRLTVHLRDLISLFAQEV